MKARGRKMVETMVRAFLVAERLQADPQQSVRFVEGLGDLSQAEVRPG
jgi:hypothetical protein